MRFAFRQRRRFASLVLAAWLSALAVSVAHACAPGEAMPAHGVDAMATHHDAAGPGTASDDPSHALPDCSRFCHEDTPLFAKLKLVQDPPAGEPLVLASPPPPLAVDAGARIEPMRLARAPPGVPVYLRSLRLAL